MKVLTPANAPVIAPTPVRTTQPELYVPLSVTELVLLADGFKEVMAKPQTPEEALPTLKKMFNYMVKLIRDDGKDEDYIAMYKLSQDTCWQNDLTFKEAGYTCLVAATLEKMDEELGATFLASLD